MEIESKETTPCLCCGQVFIYKELTGYGMMTGLGDVFFFLKTDGRCCVCRDCLMELCPKPWWMDGVCYPFDSWLGLVLVGANLEAISKVMNEYPSLIISWWKENRTPGYAIENASRLMENV